MNLLSATLIGVSRGKKKSKLQPLSFIKAVANEYNSGTGLGSTNKEVGVVCHFVAYEDITDGSFEVRFWHGAASAGFGEWNTGGTMTVNASVQWIDTNGVAQLTTLNNIVGTANPFEETVHRHSGVRPKVGSHYWITAKAVFTNSGYYSHGRADYVQGETLQYGASVPNYVGTTTSYSNTWNGAGDFWGPSFVGWSGGANPRPTFTISGDSNHSDLYVNSVQADIPDTLYGAPGSIARLLVPNMAGIDISIPGGTASEMSNPAKAVYRDMMAKTRSSVLFVPLGTNDIINQGDSESTYTTNLNNYVNRLGFASVFLPTIPPVITNQSTNTAKNPTRDAARISRNTALRALPNVVDIAIGTESVGSPGTLQFLSDTVDGIHFNATGNKRAATGANFNISSKISGATAIDAGFQYPTGTAYQSLALADGWGGQQAVHTTNAVYSPEHKITAALLKEDATTNSHNNFKQVTLAIASTARTYTFFAKRVTGSRNLRFQLQKSDFSSLCNVTFNLSTGAKMFTETNGTGLTISAITSTLVDDYWKFSLVVTVAAGVPTNPYLFFRMCDAAGNDNYAGDNTSSIAVWGLDIR